jgi:S1-C subfamily serine protease
MRYLLLVLALAVPAFADRQDALLLMKQQTVLVTNEGFLGSGRGSGVLIDKNHVLTCFHMANGPKDQFFVYTYPLGRVVLAHILFISPQDDLMLLKLDEPVVLSKYPELELHTYDGEHITVVGNALGSMKWYITSGVISGHEKGDLLTDAAVNHGNSGGPWFDDDGRLVGISAWGLSVNQQTIIGVSGGVSAITIAAAFDSWRNSVRIMSRLQALAGGKK